MFYIKIIIFSTFFLNDTQKNINMNIGGFKNMKKAMMIFILVLLALFSMASVCASDANHTDEIAKIEDAQAIQEIDNEQMATKADNPTFSELQQMTDDAKRDNELMPDKNYTQDSKGIAISGNHVDDDASDVACLGISSSQPISASSFIYTEIHCSDLISDQGEENYLHITLKDDQGNPVSGVIISVDLKDFNFYVTGDDGEVFVPTKDLPIGDYTAEIKFEGYLNYYPSSKTVNVKIVQYNPYIIASDVVFDYEGTGLSDVYLHDATGIQAEVVNHTEAKVEVNDYQISVSGLEVGNYTLNVTSSAFGDGRTIYKLAKIIVNPIDSNVTIENVSLDYNTTINFTVTTEGTTGITANIGSNNLTVYGYTIEIPAMDAGSYKLTVTTIPDANHVSVSKDLPVTVLKVNSTIAVSGNVFDYEQIGNVIVTTVGATQFSAQIEGQDLNRTGNSVLISGIKAGLHTLTITTTPDSNHNSVTENFTVTVRRIPSIIYTGDIVINYGEYGYITATAEGSEGFIARLGEIETTVDAKVMAFHIMGIANSTLTITTIPDENHTSVTETAQIIVIASNQTVLEIQANATEISYGDSVKISVKNITAGATGKIRYYLDNGTFIGEADLNESLILAKLDVGKYGIIANYTGDVNFAPATDVISISVNKLNTSISVDVVSSEDNVTVTVSVDKNAAGLVRFDVSGNQNYKVYIDVSNGKSVFNYVFLPGIYRVNATYTGDDHFNVNSTAASFEVEKFKTQIISSKVSTTYATEKSIVVTLTDAKGNLLIGKNVTINLNGKTYERTTNSEGQATIKTPEALAPKTYTATIKFAGDDKYLESTKSIKVVVSKAKTKITAKNKSFKLKTKTKKYTITLKSTSTGKALKKTKVTLKVNGKTYKAKTNSKGKATFKITKLNKKGKYKAVIKYKGNSKYKGVSKKVKITVKK